MAGTTLDTIVVEFGAQWTGGGVINRLLTDLSRVARGIKEVYDPSAMAGLAVGTSTQAAKFRDVGAAALTYKAQIAQVNKEMGQLGQALAGFSTSRDTNPFHGTAAEDAGRKYGELATRLDTARTGYDNLTKSASESTTAIGRFVTNLAPIAVKAGLATAAIVMLAKGVRFLYNQAAEGAAIRQTALSFDRVTQSMGNYTDLLDRMRAASKGTISDFEMMSSYLTLVAGASPELAANITAATPKLLEIAKAANVLNPALGDTTYFFESLAKGIKRSEVRWVDNLGIIVKVGEANKKYAEQLGKSVSDLTAMEKQQAYLNEVLRVGEGLIAQAGGSADSLTDSYTRLSASTANLGDSFKILMSIIAQDSVDEFSKNVVVIDNFFKEIISGILGVEEAENKRRDSANVGGFWAEFATGFIKDIPKAASGVRELALSFNLLMGGMRVYTDLSRYMDRGGGFFDFFKGEKLLSAPFEKIVAPDAGLSAFPSILEDVNGELALTEEAANRVAEAIKKWGPAADSADQAMFTVVENYQTGDRQSAYMDFVYGKRMAQYKELTAELNAANRSFNAEVMAAWREIETARTKNTASAWMGIFSGGDISSDLVVGNIKNIGSAWITVGGATTEQKERVAELRKEMEKAKEKLWDLNNGIGVQGDNAEKTAKKIEELNAEIANYGAVIAQLESDMPTGTRKKVDLGLDLDDIAVYKQFVEILGGVGASAQQLGQVGVAFGLIDPKVANAMEKVATLDTWLKDLALGVQVGDITIENSKEAADRIIAMLQSDLSMAEIKVKIRADLGEAKSQIMQDFRTDRKDPAFQGDLDVNANLDPALAAVAQATGVIQGTANKMTVDANIEPARKKLSDLVSEIEGKRVELVIQGIYRPPKNMPDSTSVEVNPGGSGGGNPGGGPGPYQQYGGGGYVRGGKGNPMAAIVHAGEYVLRPEAVEKLGVGFLDELNRGMGSSSNSVSVQNNFYGKVDTEQARTVIIQSARDAGDALADALLKTGYRI